MSYRMMTTRSSRQIDATCYHISHIWACKVKCAGNLVRLALRRERGLYRSTSRSLCMRLGTKLIRGKLADMYDTTPPCALRNCGIEQEDC